MSIGFLLERDHWRAEAERLKAENDGLRAENECLKTEVRFVAGALDGWANVGGSIAIDAMRTISLRLQRAVDPPPGANENGPAPPG